MYADAYLADEHAAHVQREWADEASRSRLARVATHVERRAAIPLPRRSGDRAFRPATEPCTTS